MATKKTKPMSASFSQTVAAPSGCLVSRVWYLHSVVLSVVVCDGLQKRLCVVAEGYSAGIEFGFIWRGGTQRAAVILVLLLIVVVVDLTGLQAPREYGGLEPFYAGTDTNTHAFKIVTRLHGWKILNKSQ